MNRHWPQTSGPVGKLIREFDWAQTVAGPMETWSETLRSCVDIILRSGMPMAILWGPQGTLIYNDAYGAFSGKRHPGILGMSVLEAWPEASAFNRHVLDTGLRGSSLSLRDQHFVLSHKDLPESVWLNVDYTPILDASGSPAGVLAIVTDVTQRVVLEHQRLEIEADLRAREAELARVQEIGRIGGLEVDLRDGFRNRRSPEYLRVHGLPPTATFETHEDWVARIHPDDRMQTEAHFRETVAGDATRYTAEYRIIRPSDGQVRWISALAIIERDEEAKPVRLLGTHIDITERKEAETRQRLLMQELTHRVRNTLAIVQSIASQTLAGAESLQQGRQKLNARLAALSRANDVLVGNAWTSASMESLAGAVIDLHGEPERFALSGPPVELPASLALSMTLVLHELATNAVKYGALSHQAPEGIVRLTWDLRPSEGGAAGREMHVAWRETGGPAVTPPNRQGFGTRLIDRLFASSMGRGGVRYEPEGVVFEMDIPLPAETPGPG